MKRFTLIATFLWAAASCGPITEKEEGGDLEFKVDFQNDSDIPIQLKVLFDLCQIDDDKAVAVAEARKGFTQTFVGKCRTDKDYDENNETVELTSASAKHNFTISSGCRSAVTCDNDGCLATLDANCKEQPTPRAAPVSVP